LGGSKGRRKGEKKNVEERVEAAAHDEGKKGKRDMS
jgi:hypothetical protein